MQLIVNTFGTGVRKQGDRFLVQCGEKSYPVSVHKVESILVTTGAQLSTDAIHLATEHNVDIVLLDKRGDPYARVWQSKMGSTAAIRRQQLEAAEDGLGLAFVKDWARTKLGNQIEFLEELRRRRPKAQRLFDGPLVTIRDATNKLEAVDGPIGEQRGTLMGLEGNAGRAYFKCLSDLMPESYRFDGRSHHPAQDGFNAALNYCYGVLYSLVEKAAIIAGLDPFIGFLHTDHYNKRSLVFDLIEPFRIIAERTTVLLFTGRRAQDAFFEPVPGGVRLTQEGRAAVLPRLNERLDKAVRYPVQGDRRKARNVKQRHVIQHEAHAVANRLIGKADIPRITETKEVFAEEGRTEGE